MSGAENPLPQYIQPEDVLRTMADHAQNAMVERRWWQNLILAFMGGMLIGAGALFSVLLAGGVEAAGPKILLTGLGFSTGFFFVILTHSVLFTEANVFVPARFLAGGNANRWKLVGAFWLIAALGNLFGAWIFGNLVHIAGPLSAEGMAELTHLTDKKLAFAETGTVAAWLRALLSGILANWLVGMAAFFAMMGRTIIGKFVPVFLAVTLFVAANFQHSPANAGYFGLLMPTGEGPGWMVAVVWNLLPVALGNMIGAMLLVAIPFYLAFDVDLARQDERKH
ncbi:formate/nitrite transporter family protein [Altererythrobacter sp.]|nr:formate/nitrite transporter family protein [Altererythrobacter sp.]